MSELWLLDNSAWARSIQPGGLPQARADKFAADLAGGRFATCLPFLLEALYSARDRQHFEWIDRTLGQLPEFELSSEAGERTVACQSQLVKTGHHRIPPVDLMIAAIADVERIGVIHYDADYDLILEHTDLKFESRWLAPRGSI